VLFLSDPYVKIKLLDRKGKRIGKKKKTSGMSTWDKTNSTNRTKHTGIAFVGNKKHLCKTYTIILYDRMQDRQYNKITNHTYSTIEYKFNKNENAKLQT
jgi:hypothetical protein